MSQPRLSRAAVIILATLISYTEASMLNSQSKFILKTENSQAFDNSSLVKTFNIQHGNIAECLEHCLQDCKCQSFQICENTKCQLCSSHKEENSSLLHDNNSCIYATYEMPSSTFQKVVKYCSDMSCSMKYNCCQQANLCPKNRTCKPINFPSKPWKRFTCKCRDGYYGENCDQPIRRSCAGYLNVRQESGKYKVVDSQNSEYEVYCHFDSDGVWTLLQSYSYGKVLKLKAPLSENHPISENGLEWSAYRLSKSRMESIKNNSTFMQFTCNYKKHHGIKNSDYVQIYLQNITKSSGEKNVDVIKLNTGEEYSEQSSATVGNVRGKIGNCDLSGCQIHLAQNEKRSLHVHFSNRKPPPCNLTTVTIVWTDEYFGSYIHKREGHSCIKNQNSTTQLWFGVRNP